MYIAIGIGASSTLCETEASFNHPFHISYIANTLVFALRLMTQGVKRCTQVGVPKAPWKGGFWTTGIMESFSHMLTLRLNPTAVAAAAGVAAGGAMTLPFLLTMGCTS